MGQGGVILEFQPQKIAPYEHLVTLPFFFGFATRGCVRRPNDLERLVKYSENSHTASRSLAPRLARFSRFVASGRDRFQRRYLKTAVSDSAGAYRAGLLCALQFDLTHGLNLAGESREGVPPKLRTCGDIKTATKCVAGHVARGLGTPNPAVSTG